MAWYPKFHHHYTTADDKQFNGLPISQGKLTQTGERGYKNIPI